MSAACGHNQTFDGVSDDYKRRLLLVIAINAAMFATEVIAGAVAGSVAMWADARCAPASPSSRASA
jgi:Co/Zn/Cd efflux system component